MNATASIQGQTVTLEAVLEARDNRLALQQRLLSEMGMPLVSFTLNIAGPVKVFPLSIKAFYEGLSLMAHYCKVNGLSIVHQEQILAHTGYEAMLCVKAPAMKIKAVLSRLEQSHSLGRFFDIDVIDLDGQKVSRTDLHLPERKCLLCEKDAFVCSRSRAHSVEALQTATVQRMGDYFTQQYANTLGSLACRALLYEVSATPKPGLVDSDNTGAHTDMDIHTFEKSALALLPYFTQFVLTGAHCSQLETLFQDIRPLGMEAEIAMLRATGGVNTHKGIIFSLGIVCAALGYLYGQGLDKPLPQLGKTCQDMVQSLALDFQNITLETATSHGERVYAKYGIMGIRGEAMAGFPTVLEGALPFFKEAIAQGYSQNNAAVLTLLHILATTDDTNIITRSDYETLKALQGKITDFLAKPIHDLQFVKDLDSWCIQQNISPGGSADLLALTLFLYFLESEV